MLFLFLLISFVKSGFSQTEIHNTKDKYDLQFKVLESEQNIGKYVNCNADSLGFSSYTGQNTPDRLPAQNRMLTLRSSFVIDPIVGTEEWVMIFPPVFYVCNIYLNGKLIAQRGDIKYGYTSRNHTTESYLLSPDLLHRKGKINEIAIELLPRYGENNPVTGIFIANRKVGETYTFWRNLISIDFIKAMLLSSFIIFLYFFIFLFQRRSENTGYYLPFSMLCLFYPFAYLTNVATFDFVDTLMLEKITRFGTAVWAYFVLYYMLEFTKITKYKNHILIGLGVLYLPFIIFGWIPDTVSGVVGFNLAYTSILNVLVTVAAITSSFIYAFRTRTKYAYILAFVYLLVIPSLTYDLYYSVVLQSKPYVFTLPYMMFLTIVVFFFIVAWQQSAVFKLASHQAEELISITEDLEKMVEERTLKIRKLSTAVEQSPTTIVITDTKGDIEYANPKFTELTGYTIQETIGKNTRVFNSGKTDRKIYKELWQTIQGGKTWQGEFINRKKNGDEFIENSVIAPIFDQEGTIINYVAIKVDITARKIAEAEIILKNEELQKLNSEKDKFFSIIAHDLRGPFNGFLGLTQIMAEDLPSLKMAEIQEIAVSMKNSATNLFRLLENLLHWARMQQGLIPFNKEALALFPIIEESVEMLMEAAKNKGIEITNEVSDLLEVFADSNMLQTVIRNLVSNAVKFTPKGGKITIRAKMLSDNDIEISINDSGIGMSKALVDNLFQLDVKTNRPGTEGEPSTGLGLLLCKEFVEKHGGKLWVKSEEGKGSTFYFSIFNKADGNRINILTNHVDPKGAELPVHLQSSGLKILIVEDDAMSQRVLTKTVRMFGREILNVRTGVHAVESCRSNPDIDLVLMDLQMPGIDGYETTRQIRQFNTKVIIIAHTASALTNDREMSIAAGCNGYISKPIQKDQLLILMQKYFKVVESD